MVPTSLGVIGLGAIGGSVAACATRNGICEVIGYAASASDRSMAARVGAVSDLTHDPNELVRRVEMVVLAVPPRACIGLLAQLAPLIREHKVLCTDVASVKSPLHRAAEGLDLREHYAGSHPLAGSHRTGFSAAAPERLVNARVYVTPLPGGEAVAREIADFWTRVCHAEPVMIDAVQHDELLSWTSHLPQVVASALAHAFAKDGPHGATVGPGGRDTTRIAASGEEMWKDILRLNRQAVMDRITNLDGSLAELRRALEHDDEDAMITWLRSAASWRRALDA